MSGQAIYHIDADTGENPDGGLDASLLIAELLNPLPSSQINACGETANGSHGPDVGFVAETALLRAEKVPAQKVRSAKTAQAHSAGKSLLLSSLSGGAPVFHSTPKESRPKEPLIPRSSSPLPTLHSADAMVLEKALEVEPFVSYITRLCTEPVNPDSSEDDSDVLQVAEDEYRDVNVTKTHVKSFDRIRKSRRYFERKPWANLELSSDDDNEDAAAELAEEEFQHLFRTHLRRKRVRRKVRIAPEEHPEVEDDANSNVSFGTEGMSPLNAFSADRKGKGEKPLSADQLRSRRKRLWVSLMKKEIPKAQKARNYNQREKVANSKRVAAQCMRAVRQRVLVSQKAVKETVWRAKRLTREMQAYWKRFDRVEKQQKRQQEKEAEEQMKMDIQLLEAKRQQRKLNFLITQTELYAHFIARKIGASAGSDETEEEILSRLDDEVKEGRLAEIDDYNSEEVKTMVVNNASQALEQNVVKTKAYNVKSHQPPDSIREQEVSGVEDRVQPSIFCGTLKNYQLKGMNWLMNLYDQGINGILADEMGLGKTIQALSILAYIAEKYNIWGPFLVITPASTLHNWQQEVSRFVPSFKIVPYWGSVQERKILRHFWDHKNLHTRGASFHLVITSYQLVISDFKYFNRIKWQYLVLDEAQAIKSASSQRWKLLLEFKCRNRLLLSGTPIQNSMAELWALLHFVMPTLFDSHDEFNDWFSKDIESSAESKTQMDETHLNRLHMILKPFMLRRIKKDVENELTDKLEILVYCPLTIRQKLLYMGLKRKIKMEDLLQGLGSQSQNSALTTSLMNIVMQFRKVCNHPELFERREAKSPFSMKIEPCLIPKIVFNENIHTGAKNARTHLLYNKFFIFNGEYVHRSLFTTSSERQEVGDSSFSYLRLLRMSPGEQQKASLSTLESWKLSLMKSIEQRRRSHRDCWWEQHGSPLVGLPVSPVAPANIRSSPVLSKLIFCSETGRIIGHNRVAYSAMRETMAHRLIRTKNMFKELPADALKFDPSGGGEEVDDHLHRYLVPEIELADRKPRIVDCEACVVPSFLLDTGLPKVAAAGRLPYVHDRGAAYKIHDHTQCSSKEGKASVLHGVEKEKRRGMFLVEEGGGLWAATPKLGWSNISIPDKECLVSDSGKLHTLDGLLTRLKIEGHRVLIYSQMTRMIDLLEEFMCHRHHKYIRLDGSSKIHERRDMVADFQQRSDIFVFLLSTRAGGLGINLTAADTVIFYDSDWNPTVDQQAMDRAHRLGQTKQVTVYRLICKGTIEERILQRAQEKSEIQRLVIHGGSFKGSRGGGELRPKEVVSLLLDDDEIERRCRVKTEEKRLKEASSSSSEPRRPLKTASRTPDSESSSSLFASPIAKQPRLDEDAALSEDDASVDVSVDDSESFVNGWSAVGTPSDRGSRDPTRPSSPLVDFLGEKLGPKRVKRGAGGKRGRPRGSRRGGGIQRDDQPGDALRDAVAAPRGGATKRGPGRPRTRPPGPKNQGSRRPPTKPRVKKDKANLPASLMATLSAKYNNSSLPPSASSSPPQTPLSAYEGPRFYTETSS